MLRLAARFAAPILLAALGLWSLLPAARGTTDPPIKTPDAALWSAAGTLLEACTCAVPCTCNFGEGPSPHGYCHAVFAYRVDTGAWGATTLSGLIFGGADGPKGNLGFLDARATPAQRDALQKMARAVFAQGGPAGGPRDFLPIRITHAVNGNDLRLDFAGRGGFTGRVILGRDGRSPVVVENNTVWPIPRAIKGKALPLAFQDDRTGAIKGDGVNANYGAFSFTGRTGDAPPVVAAPPPKPGGSCCAVPKNVRAMNTSDRGPR